MSLFEPEFRLASWLTLALELPLRVASIPLRASRSRLKHGEPAVTARRPGFPAIVVPPRPAHQFQAALRELLEAFEYASRLKVTLWEFAVEADVVRAAGLTNSDLRWLIRQRYVAHRKEVTKQQNANRTFRPARNLTLSRKSCFVLTATGAEFARRTLSLGLLGGTDMRTGSTETSKAPQRTVPFWDEPDRTLYWLGWPIKHFRNGAPNQVAVLSAFQAHHWLHCVPVTLLENDRGDAKDRLHDAIKHLNRAVRPYLHFGQESDGELVHWGWGR